MIQQTNSIPDLVCHNKNQALIACKNKNCSLPAIMCYNKKCECKKGHQMCNSIQIDPVINQLIKNKKQISKQGQAIFNQVQEIINRLLDNLSEIKNQLNQAKQYFGLKKNQRILYSHIMNFQFEKIKGLNVFEVYQELQDKKQYQLLNPMQILQDWKNHQLRFNQMSSKLRQYFDWKHKIKFNSKIIPQFHQIKKWIQDSIQKPIQSFQILYRASENNFSVQQFHNKCDNTPGTLVLIKNQFEKIIGGFNYLKWNEKNNAYVSDKQKKSFIFSLSEGHKFSLKNSGDSAIYCGDDWGPNFGGCNLGIYSSGKTGSCQGLCNYYGNAEYGNNPQSIAKFSGQKSGNLFQIQQWEVFHVIV